MVQDCPLQSAVTICHLLLLKPLPYSIAGVPGAVVTPRGPTCSSVCFVWQWLNHSKLLGSFLHHW